ncbi:hypothetical protein Hypma_009170 [Hypsizygus marmoreus]|uniref:ZZ-type zinc finger-containing protein P35G2.11c n=1 Tax=Hypsizygus marmoreus TaxID=39966 RepID=A0A369JTG4_HYPMA|nr:hypothetical protein Hypma_009170 [Hypsizygus marmoreus]
MYNRPDRPLIVKCSLDTWNKKITFSSARNCTFEVLRHKVEQCYSLSSTSFAIAYKDDDGEITNISTDTDLTEAIQYFQAGDDAPLSSAASILSGRSFGNRKVTLRVQITVEYDGPSLSDTGSLVSLDEYRERNGSQQSFSFGAPSLDLDDDSITVSSRDTNGMSPAPSRSSSAANRAPRQLPSSHSDKTFFTSRPAAIGDNFQGEAPKRSLRFENGSSRPPDPFSDDYELSATERYPEDPSAVFERLKLQEEFRDDQSSVDFDSLARNDRGVAWLKDQNERTIRSMLGVLPEPSVSDGASIAPQTQEELGGALALERDPRGRYYYTYTAGSAASQTHDSGEDDGLSGGNGPVTKGGRPRPTSMHLNWLASQQIPAQDTRAVKTSLSVPSFHTHHSDPLPSNGHYVEKDLLQYLPLSTPPPETLTDCSECGTLLDAIRYVCSTCGEKFPVSYGNPVKGKGKASFYPTYGYPPQPPPPRHPLSSSPLISTSSSPTYVGSYVGSYESADARRKPLPTVPSSTGLTVPSVASLKGYELCSGCIESAGVNHAIEAGLAPGSSPGVSVPASPEDAQAASQWRRAAPKKGQLRHAYREKVWGHNSWEDVEQDEAQISKCSTCGAITLRRRYKCTSCPNINLCRACYSQVHELHPSHAFLIVPDRRVRSNSEPDFLSSPPPDPSDEQSMKHPGVKCAHCLLDIVGARFHCAICDSIDICSNCESAGLPGNLDSADGGHVSSHILIKIPYPLETAELKNASQRAFDLWTGRDAASVGLSIPRSKPSSVVSSYARTVVGSGSRHTQDPDDHHLFCNGCSKPIIGIRYQCANCASSPRAYNLCQDCEAWSYSLHDPMHVFFKLPRPVQRPLESSFPMVPVLYRAPVGPPLGTTDDPKAYLHSLVHSSAVCDRCMTCIQGEWFRCAYCARDLCDACESVDTHDDTHVFLVFKAPVDMQVFKTFANLESPEGSPPVIPYPVYR